MKEYITKEYCKCKSPKLTRHGQCKDCGLITKESDKALNAFIEKVRKT